MAPKSSFTGVQRRRTTRGAVVVADALARFFITAGGIGTILAVTGVMVFLVWVAVPLFHGADVEATASVEAGPGAAPLHVDVDEYGVLGWALHGDGRVRSFRLDDGSTRSEVSLGLEAGPTCTSFSLLGSDAVVGTEDGRVQLLDIGFATRFLEPAELPAEARAALDSGAGPVDLDDGVVELTPQGQYRQQRLVVTPGPLARAGDGPVRLVSHVQSPRGPLVAALVGDGAEARLVSLLARGEEDFMTGETVLEFRRAEPLPFEAREAGASFLVLNGTASDVLVAWADGAFQRVHLAAGDDAAFLAERGRLVPPGDRVTALTRVLGDNTIVWGDSAGRLRGSFLVRLADGDFPGLPGAVREPEARFGLALAKELPSREGAAVTALAGSRRSRLVAAGFADGHLELFNVSNEGLLARHELPGGDAVEALAVAPKEDELLVRTTAATHVLAFDPRHAEATPGALFTRQWYEGYPAPEHTWQSSSGHTGFEPKLGLIPLVVGTLKATFYSMIFGAPLAILAAIYSSEFLARRVKGVVKPTVELMASLPSVVLGFLAALVFAPFVEEIVPVALAVFVCIPFAFFLCAHLWQIVPSPLQLRWARYRLLILLVPVLVGAGLAQVVGPLVERTLFAGDLKGWCAWGPELADARPELAAATGGWFVLLLPFAGVAAAVGGARWIGPLLRARAAAVGRSTLAVLDLGRFLAVVVGAVVLSLAAGAALDASGFDPRASLFVWGIDLSPVGTYVQRNSLIVGFVMGFAVIPIIYTIADDALTAVPDHLRSASLGAGATPWQTATRIILPTAMSGMFSALMVGLGRAVGETMIVLMATGNTPILDFNVFSGFRTLSANIAVELPEAVKGSTHYRTLFLAALVLFVMTFAVNTVAEIVRMRFRRRAYQL